MSVERVVPGIRHAQDLAGGFETAIPVADAPSPPLPEPWLRWRKAEAPGPTAVPEGLHASLLATWRAECSNHGDADKGVLVILLARQGDLMGSPLFDHVGTHLLICGTYQNESDICGTYQNESDP